MRQTDLINKLQYFRRLSKANKPKEVHQFVDRAYDNAISKIRMMFPINSIVTSSMIQESPISKKMKEKLLSDINADSNFYDELVSKLGIGEKKAGQLISLGLKSVDQLKQKKWLELLPKSSQVLIIHPPMSHFSRKVIENIEGELLGYDNVVLVGSYRRGVPYCGDIDIMLVSNKENAIADYINYLSRKMVIIVYNKGLQRTSFLIKIGDNFYKADVFRASRIEKYTALVYSTGSREFNIKLRAHAKKLGYLLNQSGLFLKKGDSFIRKKISSEKDLFDKLGVKYIPPESR